MGRVLPIATITGVPASIDNRYVAGSGVGASNIANRRAKMRAVAPLKTSGCACVLDKKWKMAL